MADDITIPATGSGTATPVVATQDRSSRHFQEVLVAGAATVAADDVSVTTTTGQIVAARTGRQTLVILASPGNTDDIYVGASGVAAETPASGFRLQPGAAITINTTAAIHGDAVSGTQTIYYIESYD